MTAYKLISDSETTVVMVSGLNMTWRPCATVKNEEEANLYIATQMLHEVALDLKIALFNVVEGISSDFSRVEQLCHALRQAIYMERDARELADARKGQVAA
ncbi:MAG: hypothetical protein LC793_24030 [Thermomicrobia bacterium]|nr:hypothetical protein [Thermomicrobia bacterium]